MSSTGCPLTAPLKVPQPQSAVLLEDEKFLDQATTPGSTGPLPLPMTLGIGETDGIAVPAADGSKGDRPHSPIDTVLERPLRALVVDDDM